MPTIKWNDPEVAGRLYIATVASMSKIDIHEIARLYGNNMTYAALECHLRPVRKAAAALKQEAVGRTLASGASRRAKKMPSQECEAEMEDRSGDPRRKAPRMKNGCGRAGAAGAAKGVLTGRVIKKKAEARPEVKPEVKSKVKPEVKVEVVEDDEEYFV